ncbi:MAG TPA: CBS domain-containing protein [Nitrososphaeraceae archaeon]|nr:CBS domain-containing protein [Nitrososphaeraceae archaeon]
MTVNVRDIMRKDLHTIAVSSSIQDTAILMNDLKVSSLLIVDTYGNPVGLVTERDLVRRACVKDQLSSQVTNKEIMSSPLITIDAKSSASDAIDLMLKNKVRHLLIVDNESGNSGKPIGIITPLDLMRYDDYPREERSDVLEMILEYYV